MPILFFLFFLSTAAASGTGTLLLKDGTRSAVSVIDTNGCCIVVKLENGGIQIDKKQVERFIADNDSSRSDTQNSKDSIRRTLLSINKAIEKQLSVYGAKKAAISGAGSIFFQAQPISGNGSDEKAVAAFSKKMSAFLTKYRLVHHLTKEGMYFYLRGDSVNNIDCRYLALPCEISVNSSERKMNVSSFAKLDKAGNFVPTTTGTTLKALERETIVRFMIIDRKEKTIVFDERLKDVDKGLKELDPKNANDSQNRTGRNSILLIERKMEELLKKQIK